MTADHNLALARKLLSQMAQGEPPDVIAAQFSGDVQFEVAGDVGALPWIGRRTGRRAASDFFRDVRQITETLRFNVETILADDGRAVVIGELASRLRGTASTLETAFAFVLTISGAEITRFQMLEDSFAVSRAARPHQQASIRLESSHTFSTTLERLRQALESSGFRIFATIDHRAAALEVGLDLPPTTVLIYGNPRAGTALMAATPDFALELPLRVLVRADATGKTFVTFNPASMLGGKHGLPPGLADRLGSAEKLFGTAVSAPQTP